MDRRRVLRGWVALRRKELTPSSTLLLYYFGYVANQGGLLWPSWTQIEEQTGLSRRTISRCLPVLKKVGAVVSAGRVKQVSRYRLDFDKMVRELGDTGVITTPPAKGTGATTTSDQCHDDTEVVSLWHPEDPIDPVDPLIANADATAQPGEEMTKKADRKKDMVPGIPWNQNTLGMTSKQIKVTGMESLARWWKYRVHEQSEIDEGVVVDLTVKNRAILWDCAKYLEFDWDRVLPMMDTVISNWGQFRMQVKVEHEGKIGLKPSPAPLRKYLDTAVVYWQLIATQPPSQVLQSEAEEPTIPVESTTLTTETLSEDEKVDVLDALKGF